MSKKVNNKTKSNQGKMEFNVDNLRKLTEESTQNRDVRMEAAAEKILSTILDRAEEKMKNNAAEGKTRAYLYVWENPQKVEGFNILDLLNIPGKGHGPLMKKLMEHFNPDGKGLWVGWRKFPYSADKDKKRFGIFVSWYKPPPKEEKESENKD